MNEVSRILLLTGARENATPATAAAKAGDLSQILETKTRKLEQLVRLKDAKIQALRTQLHSSGQ